MTHEVQSLCVGWYMGYIRSLKRNLDGFTSAIREKENLLTAMGISYDHQGGNPSPNRDRLADGVMELIMLRERLGEELEQHQARYEHARSVCLKTEGSYVVWLNRVERKSMKEIATLRNVSLSTAKRLSYQGIEDIYANMPERYRDAIPKAL